METMTPAEFGWFLPTNGDGRQLTSSGLPGPRLQPVDQRASTLDYLGMIARAADLAGFDTLMIPTAAGYEDPWLIASALAAQTRNIECLVTLRPGTEHPDHVVHKARTLQHLSAQRVHLQLVGGASVMEQQALGDFHDHDARYARIARLLGAFRKQWPELEHGPDAAQLPRFYCGGASPAAEQLAAVQGDIYLMWGEPPQMIAERIRRMRGLAAQAGRQLRFGLRLHLFAAPTSEQAWRQVSRLVAEIPPASIASARQLMERYDSVEQQRQLRLRVEGEQAHLRKLEVSPNLWAGVGLVRGGAGTALVGSYDEVAQRISEYRELGVSHFSFSGYPHLEEALHVGEALLPRLRRG